VRIRAAAFVVLSGVPSAEAAAANLLTKATRTLSR